MSNPTSNFGWQMPTATDLVTDLPADFEVFGQAVDTDFVDLLGGTTGQILSKTSATDLDFTWIANDQGDITGVTAGNGITVTSPTGPVPTVAINTAVTADLTTAQTLTNKTLTSPALTTPTISTLTTNGDLLYGTGSGALARKAIGTTGQVLTVAAGVPSWATPATPASGMTLIKRASFSAVSTTTTTFDGLCTSAYRSYLMVVETITSSGANASIYLQFRKSGVTHASSYYSVAAGIDTAGTAFSYLAAAQAQATLCKTGVSADYAPSVSMTFGQMGNGAGYPLGSGTFYENNASRNGYVGMSTASNITADGWIFSASTGTITGTVSIYGLAI